MSWSADFIARLERRQQANRYVLQVIEVYAEPGLAYAIGSHRGLVASQGKPRIVRVSNTGPTATPRAWSSTVGQFNVTFAGDLGEVCAHITRGTIVELLVGLEGMSPADFQRVNLGIVRDVRGVGPEHTIEVFGIDAAFRQRLTGAHQQSQLFSNLGIDSTLAADYTPADTELEVVSTSSFNRETGATGAVKITPTSGDPFYLTYTGTATGPVRFTGLSATGACGTTAVAAVTGDRVEEVAYLSGHPLDIARKILASRGTGNGSYDAYPAAWGLGLLDELIDHDDIDQVKANIVSVASGTYKWEYIQQTLAEDGFAWLAAFLRPAGLILTVRQGSVTIRAAQNSQTGVVSGYTLADKDIARFNDYDAFDYRHMPEHTLLVVNHSTGDSFSAPSAFGLEDAATLPSALTYVVDLSDRIFTNASEQVYEVHHRVQESVYRVPERIVVTCPGLRLAPLANLDLFEFTSKILPSRRDGAAGFTDRRAVIEQITPRWFDGVVDLSFLVYPETGDLFA